MLAQQYEQTNYYYGSILPQFFGPFDDVDDGSNLHGECVFPKT